MAPSAILWREAPGGAVVVRSLNEMLGHDDSEEHVSTPVAGTVQIANDVLADLAGYAALEVYGVVGMTTPTLRNGVAQVLSRDKLRRGIRVKGDGGVVSVDLYVVVEHGTNIAEVSRNLAARVEYILVSIADVQVGDVNVHVQSLKVRT